MGGSLENPTSDLGFFSCSTICKIRKIFFVGAKETEGGQPLEKNSSDPGIVSRSNRWAGKWFWPGTYPPQPSVGARWRLGKEKGVTDFSVTPWHASWWSWRESNPRPLECYASSPLKSLTFFKKIQGSHRAFVGSCQQSPVGLWRISQHTANGQPTRLWRACQRTGDRYATVYLNPGIIGEVAPVRANATQSAPPSICRPTFALRPDSALSSPSSASRPQKARRTPGYADWPYGLSGANGTMNRVSVSLY